MKKVLFIIVLLLLVPIHANADNWTIFDTTLQLTYTTLHIMDWRQTQIIANSCYNVTKTKPSGTTKTVAICDKYETNFILGDHPSEGRVNTYFATTLALHWVASYYLPKPYRTIFQGTWIIIEYDIVQQNRSIGIGFNFHF